jgi:hypothetical protein
MVCMKLIIFIILIFLLLLCIYHINCIENKKNHCFSTNGDTFDNVTKINDIIYNDISFSCNGLISYIHNNHKKHDNCNIKTLNQSMRLALCYNPNICNTKYVQDYSCDELYCKESNINYREDNELIMKDKKTKYVLMDEYEKYDFVDQFNFMENEDPYNGLVMYQNKLDSLKNGLIEYDGNKTIINISKHVENNGEFRKGVRLESKKNYNGGLFILDVDHIPCGDTVMAKYWLSGKNWPCDGEIDIIDSINSINWLTSNNRVSLHTNQKCTQNIKGITNNGHCGNGIYDATCIPCDNSLNGYKTKDCAYIGCGLYTGLGTSGYEFNKHGGGVYICEWIYDGEIKIWIIQRNEMKKYMSINKNEIYIEQLPKPNVIFSPCVGSFKNNHILISTMLCSDDVIYDRIKNNKTQCKDYVQNNDNDYGESYWKINHIRVYSREK